MCLNYFEIPELRAFMGYWLISSPRVITSQGERHLILKKKYKQLMQERDCEAGARADTGSKCNSSSHTELQSSALEEKKTPSGMEVERRSKPAQVSWCGPTITVTEVQEKEHTEDVSIPNVEPCLPEKLLVVVLVVNFLSHVYSLRSLSCEWFAARSE